MRQNQYAVILVHSTSHAMRIEKLLQEKGIACKMIPVPRHISSDCGVCVRIELTCQEAALRAVQAGQVDIAGVHAI